MISVMLIIVALAINQSVGTSHRTVKNDSGSHVSTATSLLPDDTSEPSSKDNDLLNGKGKDAANKGGGTGVPSHVLTAQMLGVPTSATVLALPGMDFHQKNDMPDQLQAQFSKKPYAMNVIDYPRNASKTSISTGVANLNAALRATPGRKIVLAYSQGAQVASAWMLQYANDTSAPPPSELTFILTGNPLRSGSGSGIGHLTWDGSRGIATSTSTPWHIVDVARRYDGWADWPADTNNQEAVKNANKGKTTIHTKYSEVDLYNPTNTFWVRGNTTFVLTYEAQLPMYIELVVSDEEAAATRARIESAYHRQ